MLSVQHNFSSDALENVISKRPSAGQGHCIAYLTEKTAVEQFQNDQQHVQLTLLEAGVCLHLECFHRGEHHICALRYIQTLMLIFSILTLALPVNMRRLVPCLDI